MKVFKLLFTVLVFLFLIGCQSEAIIEEEKSEEEEVLIEKVSEEEGIAFILFVLEGEEENISNTPVFMIDDEIFFATEILDQISEMNAQGEMHENDEEAIKAAIARIKILLGLSKYFDQIGIIVTEKEIDQRIQEFINFLDDENIKSIDDFYQYVFEVEGRSVARIRENFSNIIRRDKMFEKFFDQYEAEVTETELVALYQEKLEEIKGTGFKLVEYGEYREYLLSEIVQNKILSATNDDLGEVTESLEIIYFKE